VNIDALAASHVVGYSADRTADFRVQNANSMCSDGRALFQQMSPWNGAASHSLQILLILQPHTRNELPLPTGQALAPVVGTHKPLTVSPSHRKTSTATRSHSSPGFKGKVICTSITELKIIGPRSLVCLCSSAPKGTVI
jgi:hypothetical protein